ncbi:hypothetical protein ACFQJC_18050 [Haloferax namakaokahaiae]|uniref:Uncharacterized protein n=1 Tax=Haloferax namakaokahaiae TaxID=1748331 RepID=A0ABD5ZKI9_9EURY
MPKENRFAGLGDAIDDGEADQPEAPRSESESVADEEADRSDESDKELEDSGSGPDRTEQAPEGTTTDGTTKDENESEVPGPAFEFEATTAKSIYVRRATLDQLDDAEFEVESLLRREHDIRNLTGREFHDALVRVATEYPDEIVGAILETRNE